jgi:uncharacterized protein YqjF (DUF2071 family)
MALLQAPAGLMTGRRRRTRPGHVLVTVQDLLIVTWDVPEAALRPLLPSSLRLWSHQSRARLSAVLFRNRSLRPAWLGVPRLGCCQVNLRTYLVDPRTGRPGAVFFHALCLGSKALARFSSPIAGVPFRHLAFDIAAERASGGLRWRAVSPDGAVRGAARETEPAALPDADTLDLLTNVHTGFVARGPDAALRTWSIWHRSQSLRTVAIEELHLQPLAELQLPLGAPEWAWYVDSIDYEVYLPARQVSRFKG